MKRWVLSLVMVLIIGTSYPVMAQDATPVGTPTASSVGVIPSGSHAYASDPAIYGARPLGPFEQGAAGELAIVDWLETSEEGRYLAILRNNTPQTFNSIEVTATISGEMGPVGLGVSSIVNPAVLVPGDLGFMFVQVEGDLSPEERGSDPEFVINRAEEVADPSGSALRVASVIANAEEVIVAVAADEYVYVDYVTVAIMCFTDPSFAQIRWTTWSVSSVELDDRLERGGTVAVPFDSPGDCDGAILVSAQGF